MKCRNCGRSIRRDNQRGLCSARECVNLAQREYNNRNAEIRRIKARADYYATDKKLRVQLSRQSREGISAMEHNELWASQEGRCALCHEPFSSGKRTHLDHAHGHHGNPRQMCPGCIRGFLHPRCNHKAGVYDEDGWPESFAWYRDCRPLVD